MRLDELFHPTPTLVSLIEQHCGEILAALRRTKTRLYRGIYGKTQPYYIGFDPLSRGNRRPDDFQPGIEQLTDWYMRRLGLAARRLNSAFATTSQKHAEQYGEVFYFFPVDGFKFSYGEQIDLYPELQAWLWYDAQETAAERGYPNAVLSRLRDAGSDLHLINHYIAHHRGVRQFITKEFLTGRGFTDQDIDVALAKHYELHVLGRYHLVRCNSEEGDMLMEQLGL